MSHHPYLFVQVNGTSQDFAKIDDEFRRRGVSAQHVNLPLPKPQDLPIQTFLRLYRVPERDLLAAKLPVGNDGPMVLGHVLSTDAPKYEEMSQGMTWQAV